MKSWEIAFFGTQLSAYILYFVHGYSRTKIAYMWANWLIDFYYWNEIIFAIYAWGFGIGLMLSLLSDIMGGK